MKVLSSYQGQMRTWPPTPWGPHSILYLDDKGKIFRWARGESGWLCALPERARQDSILELGKAGTQACWDLAAEVGRLEVLWVGGREPSGMPIGLHEGELCLPTSEWYYRSGWLDPGGMFYPCGEFEHDRLASVLCERGTTEMERTWIRISMCKARNVSIANDMQCEFLLKHKIKGIFDE